MPTAQTKGITVKIDAELHAEIKAYLEQHEMTMSEFITLAAQDELHPKMQEVEVQKMAERTRTLAFQVPESLFQRIKDYLARNQMTQRAFVIGLIEEELDRDEELLHQQDQAEDGSTEEEQEDGPVEATAPDFSPNEGADEYDHSQEETPAVGDIEDNSDELTDEEDEALYEEEVLNFDPDERLDECDPDQEEAPAADDFEDASDEPAEEQDEGFSEDESPGFGPNEGLGEYDPSQEETPAVGDFEGDSDELTEEPDEGFSEDEAPAVDNFEGDPDEPAEEQDEEEYMGMSM